MNWTQYIPYEGRGPDIGKVTSVFLNDDETLIKKYYIPGGITVNGNPTEKSEEYINQKFETECNILTEFNGLWFMPELVEINTEEKYIIQEYCGPDLLTAGFDGIENIEDQVVSIFEYISNAGYYKLNGLK